MLEDVVPDEALEAAVVLGPAVLPDLVAAVLEGVVLGEALALKKRFMRMENQATVNSHKPVGILWEVCQSRSCSEERTKVDSVWNPKNPDSLDDISVSATKPYITTSPPHNIVNNMMQMTHVIKGQILILQKQYQIVMIS